MPIHDWTKVIDGIFHDFHGDWIQVIKHTLNGGILPTDYYALSEQVAVGVAPDVLTLDRKRGRQVKPDPAGTALVTANPKTRFATELSGQVKRRKNRIAVRHASDDRVVAMIEIVSRGNKSSARAIRAFVGKAADLLANGVHLLIVDIQPLTNRDPDGIHSLIQQEFGGPEFIFPPEKEFTLASYQAVDPPRAYIEPVAVGDELPDMPLFLVPGGHVLVPLEKTYQTAYEGVPARWREVIEAPAT
jgi:hypothetical protein